MSRRDQKEPQSWMIKIPFFIKEFQRQKKQKKLLKK